MTDISRRWNPNPLGIGGFKDHPEYRFRVGEEGFARCTAMSKRSKRRCKLPPVNGCGGVCRWHGARGGWGNHTLPKDDRTLRNKEIKRARLMAEAEVARRFATGEAVDVLREAARAIRPWIGKIHPADEARAVLMMEAHLEGMGQPDGLTGEAWRETLRALGVMPQRPLPPTPAPEP